jgi:ketosteroid isomerase-like protein
MSDKTCEDLVMIEEQWSQAIVSNDVDAISRFVSDDWLIIGADGRMVEGNVFLNSVRSGDLTHSLMASDEWRVRVYDDFAVVTARVKSGGQFRGDGFETTERSTSMYVKRNGTWQCVLTQLTAIKPNTEAVL